MADWERGLELFLLRHEENIRAVTTWLIELQADPGELLISARHHLAILRQSTSADLVRAYRELPEAERCYFTGIGRRVREDAERVTRAIVGILAEAGRFFSSDNFCQELWS